MYMLYIVLLSCHIIFASDNDYIVYAIFAFQIFYFLFFELPQLIKESSQYLSEISSCLELLSTIGVSIYCIQYIVDKTKIFYVSLYFGVLFGYWRCFNYIQVFGQSIRTNVIMYQRTIVNLIPFLSILMLF